MGNLQRGWMSTQSVPDGLVLEDSALLSELAIHAEVLVPRYRTGVTTVTPATSCVQDSNQTLLISIDHLRLQYSQTLKDRSISLPPSGSSGVAPLHRLRSLAGELEQRLTPFETVRKDGRGNS